MAHFLEERHWKRMENVLENALTRTLNKYFRK